jgi:transposase
MTVKTVGLDLAKDVFQVHGISENGRVIFNRAIKRAKLLAFFETLPDRQIACAVDRPTIGVASCANWDTR